MLKKCDNCGRFFGDENGSNVCNACKLSTKKFKSTGDVERDKFVTTRDLVYDNPDISPQGIIDIMAEMGLEITLREIMKYVDEGRLSLNTVKDGDHCISCGTKVAFGKYCDRCRLKQEQQKAVEDFKNKFEDQSQSGKPRMHINEKKK